MTVKIDVAPTVEIIRKMADTMRERAQALDHLAVSMEKSNTLDRAGEAAECVIGMLPNLRMDLLVTRPLREYERANRD